MTKFIKISILFSVLCSLFSVLAEPELVECASNPDFASNSCDVCYTSTHDGVSSGATWSGVINEFTIPWKHDGGDKDEIIYDTEQVKPTIVGKPTVESTPSDPNEIWEDHADIVWTPFTDHKEVLISTDDEIGLYRMKNDANLRISGTSQSTTLMFVTPLALHHFDPELSAESARIDRNICIQARFEIAGLATTLPPENNPGGGTEVPTVTPPETSTPSPAPADNNTTEDPLVLDAAGPAPITGDVTKPETGPELLLILLLAFVFAGGWSAWQRSKS